MLRKLFCTFHVFWIDFQVFLCLFVLFNLCACVCVCVFHSVIKYVLEMCTNPWYNAQVMQMQTRMYLKSHKFLCKAIRLHWKRRCNLWREKRTYIISKGFSCFSKIIDLLRNKFVSEKNWIRHSSKDLSSFGGPD